MKLSSGWLVLRMRGWTRVGLSGQLLWVPGHSLFSRTTRFASFPDYLVIQIKKFTFGLDWVPKKLGMVAGTSKGG